MHGLGLIVIGLRPSVRAKSWANAWVWPKALVVAFKWVRAKEWVWFKAHVRAKGWVRAYFMG